MSLNDCNSGKTNWVTNVKNLLICCSDERPFYVTITCHSRLCGLFSGEGSI